MVGATLDVEEGVYRWTRPSRGEKARVLSAGDVTECVEEVVGGGHGELEKMVVLLQARSRGFIVSSACNYKKRTRVPKKRTKEGLHIWLNKD